LKLTNVLGAVVRSARHEVLMRLVLSAAEQRLLADTTRVLLSPLDEPLEPWRARVLEHLARLLGAEMGGFILPAGEAAPYTLHNLPDSFAREYFDTVAPIDSSFVAIRATETSVWSTRLLARLTGVSVEEGWFASDEYREFYSRYGVEEGIGYVVRTEAPLSASGAEPGTGTLLPGAVLSCLHGDFGTEERDARGLAILRLLQPALEAGVAGRVRMARVRDTLAQAFDAMRDGLEVADAAGRRLHANAALRRMLADDPEADAIESAVARVTDAMRRLLSAREPVDAVDDAGPARLEVLTATARYQVSGQITAGAGCGVEQTILVSVVQLTPTLPAPLQLQDRWGLSPQEARVALLLAQGRSNAGIAAEMGLRPATVRHYTESVFHKLGVHSRGEVAQRILFA
jgi:DNA-binding NarL/FixJ family response regulator